jgi:GT2 family glycosyltransferase
MAVYAGRWIWMTDVSIIIVNYNTTHVLTECLTSIRETLVALHYEVIVIDNASPDNSATSIQQQFPWIRLLESRENLGFGAGCNLGAQNARGKYLLFLNPDTVILNDAVQQFFEFMEQPRNSGIGACGSILVGRNGEPTASGGAFKRPSTESINRVKELAKKLLFIRRSVLKSSLRAAPPTDAPVLEVEYISGADLFVRTMVFRQLGGFDPRFFMYVEEVDLQMRMLRQRYRSVLIRGPAIQHLEGASFDNVDRRHRVRIMLQASRLRYFEKHWGRVVKSLYKYFYLSSVIVELVIDLYRKEYTFAQNAEFARALLRERYN